MDTIAAIIKQAWQENHKGNDIKNGPFQEAIEETICLLNKGQIRVAEAKQGKWLTNEWVKQAILLNFSINDNYVSGENSQWFDKIESKFANYTTEQFDKINIRVVPGAFIRKGSFFEDNVVVMPSFINIGVRVGQNTMIDSWATIGACAQIGKNCHISSNVVIGGVLEPLQSSPVIIEDNCFIGTNTNVVEGMIIRRGSVIGMGVSLGMSVPIIDKKSNKIIYGEIPEFSVVIPGSMPTSDQNIYKQCAVIIKKVDDQTRNKTAINDLLRYPA